MYNKFQAHIKFALLALILTLLPAFSNAQECSAEKISPEIMQQVKIAVHEYFKADLNENFQIKPLTGGYSAASIRIDAAGKSYVLRVISASEPTCRVCTELYAMKNAAEAGIAPAIHWISTDGHSILMDYIQGGTLSIEHSKKPEVIKNIAGLLKKVHGLPKNPFNAPSFKEHMEKFYLEHSRGSANLEIWDAAISIIRQGDLELVKLNSPSVNTHGDLNPRNVLVTSETLYFIDWSEEMYTEPYHDLAYFSILMDYKECNDNLLLKSYLDRDVTFIEKKRFALTKKMNFARLALGGLYIGNKLSGGSQEVVGPPSDVKEWSFYAEAFAGNEKDLPAQFFWNLARAAIKSANVIDIHAMN